MHRALRIVGIVSLLATFAGAIVVAAHKNDTKHSTVVPSSQTFTVTNVNDSNTGSLRDAILNANASHKKAQEL